MLSVRDLSFTYPGRTSPAIERLSFIHLVLAGGGRGADMAVEGARGVTSTHSPIR
jgi:hypothetical protein